MPVYGRDLAIGNYVRVPRGLPMAVRACHCQTMGKAVVELPRIMVAPNGARHLAESHPEVPLTTEALVATARDCHAAGAGAMHFHIRNESGRHILDASQYSATLRALTRAVPEMHFQITTEAFGLYQPPQMRQLVRDVMPPGVSIAVKKIIPNRFATSNDITFYQWLETTEIAVQHICHEPDDIDLFCDLYASAELPHRRRWLLFVLGRYATGRDGDPAELVPFLERIEDRDVLADWAICAFGKTETDCLIEAFRKGGKARVGFENNFQNRDGSVAGNNAERVKEIARFAEAVTDTG